MTDSAKPSYWQLCRAEPFRVFFPLGAFVAISGVSLWPLFFSGIHQSFYPGIMHARMMIEGFLGAFVFGFLGTALPRLTDAPPLTTCELRMLLLLHLLCVGTHIAKQPVGGDAVFLVLLICFLTMMASRFRQRRDVPPPGFVLVLLGFVAAILGTALSVIGPFLADYRIVAIGKSLLHQAWLVFLILGLSGFLLARFLSLPRPSFPESITPPPGWWPRAALALVCGLLLMATFVAEVLTPWPRAFGFVRWVIASAYLLGQVPFFSRTIPNVTLTLSLRCALALLGVGLLLPVCWPLQSVAGLHVLFMGGLSLMTFTVGTRVVLGHSGFSDRFTQRLPFLLVTAGLIGVATVARVAGDFLPATRTHWLQAASYLWMIAVGVWSWAVLPKVRIAELEDKAPT